MNPWTCRKSLSFFFNNRIVTLKIVYVVNKIELHTNVVGIAKWVT